MVHYLSLSFRFWGKRIPGYRRGYDKKQSTKDLCWHTVLDGTRGDGTGESASVHTKFHKHLIFNALYYIHLPVWGMC